jgi:hypothetical protein
LSIPPYTSWLTAADSIQKCINICVFGDTIYVANGVYEEQVTMIHGLTLKGGGIDSCYIDTRNTANPPSYYAVIMKDDCSIDGFHIIVLNNQGGTFGINCRPGGGDSLYFQGKIFNNRISKAGGGITSNNAFLTIRSNIFEDIRKGIDVGALDTSVIDSIYNNYLFNIIYEGIGTDLAAGAIIHNNFIHMVSGLGNGIGLPSSSPNSKIYNNLVIGDNSDEGIILNVLPVEAVNNVVYYNFKEGIRYAEPSVVKNNLVVGAESGYRLIIGNQNVYYNNAWDCDISYYGFTADSTNLRVDPMVVNEDTTRGELDFHLQMFSPLINAGDPAILDKDSTRSDIGLYGGPFGESYVYLDLPPKPPVNLNVTVENGFITLTWNKNTEADTAYYNVYVDTVENFIIDMTKLISSQTDTIFIQPVPQEVESLYFKVTAIDKQGNESNPSEEVGVLILSVDENPIAINNYVLYQNYPNPFNPSTKIGYKLKERGYVKLYVYDIKGELVSVLVNQIREAGYYEVEFNAGYLMLDSGNKSTSGGLASGVYIYQIMIRNENNPSKPGPNGIPVFTDIKKMIYLK